MSGGFRIEGSREDLLFLLDPEWDSRPLAIPRLGKKPPMRMERQASRSMEEMAMLHAMSSGPSAGLSILPHGRAMSESLARFVDSADFE